VVEFVVRWPDPRGRVHEIVLPRPISVVPVVTLAVADKPIVPDDAAGWAAAPQGALTAWSPQEDASRPANHAVRLRADRDYVYARVRVADDVPSYWPSLALEPAWGGLASDAVSLAWAGGEGGGDQQIRRIWVLPHAPQVGGAVAIWSNTGLGAKQTPLAPVDAKWGIRAAVAREAGGFTVTFALPRKLVCVDVPPTPDTAERVAATARLTVSVHDNDETARTWTRSWTHEEAGIEAWGQLQLIQRVMPDEPAKP
jgi:hypothetical protein